MNIIHKDVNKLITIEGSFPLDPPLRGAGFTIWERSHESEFNLANIFGVYMHDIDVFIETWSFNESKLNLSMFHDMSSTYNIEYECLRADFPDMSEEYLHKETQRRVNGIKEKFKNEFIESCFSKKENDKDFITETGNWSGMSFIWRIHGSSWVVMYNSEWASFGKVNQK